MNHPVTPSTTPDGGSQPEKYCISRDVFELLSPVHKIVADCLIRKGDWILVDGPVGGF